MAKEPTRNVGRANSATDADAGLLTQDSIVSVARHLLESSGLESVTMRRLATELGVTPMALYHHVPNKQALLALVIDAVIGTVDYPEADVGAWYERIRQGLLSVHREIARYPGLGMYVWGPNRFYSSGLRKVRATLATLTDAGFDEDEALSALYLLTAYLGGYFLMEEQPHLDQAQQVFELKEGGEVELRPSLRSKKDLSSYQSFLRGVDTIIAGLRAQLAAKQVLMEPQRASSGRSEVRTKTSTGRGQRTGSAGQ